MSVVIYSKRVCPYCVKAKNLLNMKKVSFKEIMVDDSPEILQEMLQRSNNRRTVPQIFIHGQGIGGFDDLRDLDRAGKLDALLQNNSSQTN